MPPFMLKRGAKSMPRYPEAKVPSSCEHIPLEFAMRVLAESWGNVSKAAAALGVPSRDFRLWVQNMPALSAVVDEVMNIYCDRAEAILREALESPNEARRDVASRFVLNGKGASRGWARPQVGGVTIQQPSGPIVIKWLEEGESDPLAVSNRGAALIDARPIPADEPSRE